MSFRPTGQPTRQGAEFINSAHSGRVFAEVDTGSGATVCLVDPVPVAPMGADRVAQAGIIRSNSRERVFTGAPKFWRITNRAEHGNVKVWMGAFDGEVYPEGATDDKRSWLQPGESMIVPMEAGLHFCGNIFDPRLPDCQSVIERTGGFTLETEATSVARNAPVRIIGGPIGLPDFIIEPLDGRERRIGAPIALYDTYDKATRKFWVRRKGQDQAVLEAEKELLEDRIREYTLDDQPLYDYNGEIASTATSRAAADEAAATDDLPDMRTVELEDDAPTPRRSRRT